jgi:hypothetical protein
MIRCRWIRRRSSKPMLAAPLGNVQVSGHGVFRVRNDLPVIVQPRIFDHRPLHLGRAQRQPTALGQGDHEILVGILVTVLPTAVNPTAVFEHEHIVGLDRGATQGQQCRQAPDEARFVPAWRHQRRRPWGPKQPARFTFATIRVILVASSRLQYIPRAASLATQRRLSRPRDAEKLRKRRDAYLSNGGI